MSGRSRVHFDSEGVECSGYLYHPTNSAGNLPCVVVCHGFSGTQDTSSIQYLVEKFVDEGFAVLTFDYRNFGESEGTPRQLLSIQGQQADIRAAIHFARSQEEIDPERIALWGTSLGGGHVVTVAAVVAHVPFNGFPKEVEGRSVAQTVGLLGAMFRDVLHGLLGRPPYYIPAIGASDELCVIGSPQAERAIEAMDSHTWRNEVAPRSLFSMMRYKPGNEAHRLEMPLLVCVAESDREVPPELSRQIVVNAPDGTSRAYPVTHFDVYRPNVRQQVVQDQISFLHEHLNGEQT